MQKIVTLVMAIIWILLTASCSQSTDSPEQQVRQLVSSMESAVEQRSLDSVRELVDDEYSDEWNGSRRSALRALMFYFQGHQSIHLLTRITNIQLNDDASAASVIVYVGMAGEPIEESASLIGLKVDLYRFDIELVADGDEWQVKSASWQRARPDSLGLLQD